MDSPDELRSPEEPSSIPDSQDSVQRVVNRFIRGSQGSEPTSGANVVPISEASHTYQTSNHYELDEGRNREHVEYSINHRLEFHQPGPHPVYSQSQASQQYPGGYPPPPITGYYPALRVAPLFGLNGMPNNLNEPSHFGFRVVFDEQQPTSKSATQTYSHKLQKWYVKMDSRCTITFQFDMAPPQNAQVRLVVVYKAPTMLSENVECCVKHKQSESKEYGAEKSGHFVKSLDRNCQYFTPDLQTRRFCVVVPVEAMQFSPVGCSSESKTSPVQYTAVLRFPCYTSELPKQSKGTVQLLCGLEVPHASQFLSVARATVDVRVCASPGRDRMDAEGIKEDPTEGSSSPKLGSRRKRGVSPTVSQHVAISSVKKTRLSSSTKDNEHGGPYTITTPHKDIYEMLLKIKDSLELTKQYTDDQIKQAATQGILLPGFSPPSSQEPTISDVKTILDWLKSISMERYSSVFEALGINELFQLERVKKSDLLSQGIPEADASTILDSRPADVQPEVTVAGDTQPIDASPTEPQVISSVEFRFRRTITGGHSHHDNSNSDHHDDNDTDYDYVNRLLQ